jgi:hypothetical protein
VTLSEQATVERLPEENATAPTSHLRRASDVRESPKQTTPSDWQMLDALSVKQPGRHGRTTEEHPRRTPRKEFTGSGNKRFDEASGATVASGTGGRPSMPRHQDVSIFHTIPYGISTLRHF